jgi:hypothetical protein
MIRRSILFLGLAVMMAWAPLEAMAQEKVGQVTRLEGRAARGDGADLALGAPIHRFETVLTGGLSRLEITFLDQGVLVLGDNARLVIDEYVYDPGAGRGNVAVSVVQGAFRAVTGRVAELAGKPYRLRTPLATIGIRGTEFWGGTIDGAFGIALLDGAGLIIESAQGRIEIARVGDGTTLRPGQAPEAPVAWTADKVGRAVATVAFRP